jgi:hypothetical protein
MRRFLLLAPLAAMLFFLVGCELTYGEFEDTTDSTPEILLSGAKITRYEKRRLTAELSADLVEQYKNSNTIYGSNVSFVVYENDETEIGRGSCGLFSADTVTENYVLFDSIQFENIRDQFELQAAAIKWSAKSGLLASEKGGIVSIIQSRRSENSANKSRFSLSGTEFSVHRNTRTFEFNAPVAGTFETEDYTDEE